MNDQVIAAVSRGVMATLADGTLRVKIDIEPNDAELAFKLLGMPGNPIAIARLTTPGEQPKSAPQTERKTGGPLARLAGLWCAEEAFADWLADTYPDQFNAALGKSGGDIEGAAAHLVRWLCNVESRADLDHDPVAAELFHDLVRRPFAEHRS